MSRIEKHTVRDRFASAKKGPMELRNFSLKTPEKKDMVLDLPRIFKNQNRWSICEPLFYSKYTLYHVFYLNCKIFGNLLKSR